MRTQPDISRSERGTAAVEFALVLPLVLVVALALVQTGLFVRDRLLVEAAARAGARVQLDPMREGERATLSARQATTR